MMPFAFIVLLFKAIALVGAIVGLMFAVIILYTAFDEKVYCSSRWEHVKNFFGQFPLYVACKRPKNRKKEQP